MQKGGVIVYELPTVILQTITDLIGDKDVDSTKDDTTSEDSSTDVSSSNKENQLAASLVLFMPYYFGCDWQ